MQSVWPLVFAVVLLCFLLWLGYTRGARISGFGPHVVKRIETFEYPGDDEEPGHPEKRSITTETQSARTVWEWLTILTISAVIAGAALIFTTRQADQQREIQVQQANDAQELQIQQANDEALQSYLDQMSTLLIEEDLRTSPEDSEARMLARSRTLTILSRLDPRRRSRVLQFLLEAELVQRIEQKNPVINLSGANLSGVSVRADTDLSYADLSGTNLSDAILSDANLSTAYLMATDLHDANLSGATLSFGDLGLADLSDANLSDADLTLANLNDADLTDADLTGADLWNADLTDAKGVTKDSLVEHAGYVGQTTMPGGHYVSEQISTTGGLWGEYPSGKIPPGIPGMKIPAGEYNSDEYVPAFHFEVDEGWQSTGDVEATDYIALAVEVEVKGGEYHSDKGTLLITNPSYVFAASNLSEQKDIPAPESTDKWVSWFQELQEHPNLDTSEPMPVNVGSASGTQIDVTVASTPENHPKTCYGLVCIPLYHTNYYGVAVYEGRTERFYILDVGEEMVVANVSIPGDNSKEFSSKARKLLDTLEWKGV